MLKILGNQNEVDPELHRQLGHRHQPARRSARRTSRAGWCEAAEHRRDLGLAAPGAPGAVAPELPALPRRAPAHDGAARRPGRSADAAAPRPPARGARPEHVLHRGSARSPKASRPAFTLARPGVASRARRRSTTAAARWTSCAALVGGRAAARQAAAPVPPDAGRPQPQRRERPARDGQRAAGARPDRHSSKGQGFTGLEAFWNYVYWQTLAINPFD